MYVAGLLLSSIITGVLCKDKENTIVAIILSMLGWTLMYFALSPLGIFTLNGT